MAVLTEVGRRRKYEKAESGGGLDLVNDLQRNRKGDKTELVHVTLYV